MFLAKKMYSVVSAYLIVICFRQKGSSYYCIHNISIHGRWLYSDF